MQYDVFISYRRTDQSWVVDSILSLLKRGQRSGRHLRIFFDSESLLGGSDWEKAISEIIASSGRFIAVWSKGYWESEVCRRELDMALRQDPEFELRFVVPILKEDCVPLSLDHRIQYIDSRKRDFEQQFIRDLEILPAPPIAEGAELFSSPWKLDWDRSGRSLERISPKNAMRLTQVEELGNGVSEVCGCRLPPCSSTSTRVRR